MLRKIEGQLRSNAAVVASMRSSDVLGLRMLAGRLAKLSDALLVCMPSCTAVGTSYVPVEPRDLRAA
jgi:hypothetical protein